MNLFELAMLLSILLVTLVAGIVLTFAVVVMPGIRPLSDRDFLQSFKAMDRVIQRNHPVLVLVWIGSFLAVVVTFGLGLFVLETIDRIFLVTACSMYTLGVMLPTARINVPLNNELQNSNLTTMSDEEIKQFRFLFESTWNRWNIIRTVLATATAIVLLIVLIRN
jgi:uncharacterized membrane protein